jgi:sugar phosphate isomerase/epimerase
MKPVLILLASALSAFCQQAPLFVFDNGLGLKTASIEEQADLARKTGYAGIFYTGTSEMPRVLEAHRSRGLKLVGIYTGMNLSDAKPAYDPGLPEAIRQLKGTGALITFTVSGKSAEGDNLAVPVIREVADMAAAAGLKVALYPHYGFHVARVEDGLRMVQKVGRSNVGIVFNLCHWLRSGDEANMTQRINEAASHTLMVNINGADHEGDWDRLIQPLDRGAFDVKSFLAAFAKAGYQGPVALQCYNVPGDKEQNLIRSMKAWRALSK